MTKSFWGRGALKRQIASFIVERIGNTARSLALGRYAYEEARQWALQREQFDRSRCEFQGLPSPIDAAIAKAYCNQIGLEVANEALQSMGATGYSMASLVEYGLRRCRGSMVAGGSIEMLHNRIAEGVFERSFPQRPPKLA